MIIRGNRLDALAASVSDSAILINNSATGLTGTRNDWDCRGMRRSGRWLMNWRGCEMYRIAWKSKITGYCGHGEWQADLIAVQSAIAIVENEFPEIEHWIEEPNHPRQQPCVHRSNQPRHTD
jgi:hypothetical protein